MSAAPMTGSALLAKATRRLAEAGIPDPGRDARRLLAHVLKVPPGRLTLFLPDPVESEHALLFNAVIESRAAHVPVSHITGRRQFYGREFLVTPEVLDPRPETEILIEAALAGPSSRVLDLGTGSGCILLTLLCATLLNGCSRATLVYRNINYGRVSFHRRDHLSSHKFRRFCPSNKYRTNK